MVGAGVVVSGFASGAGSVVGAGVVGAVGAVPVAIEVAEIHPVARSIRLTL